MTQRKKNQKWIKPELSPASPTSPRQFNWRRHWSKKVAPYLDEELVQFSLGVGMTALDRDWKRGDAPYLQGALGFKRIVKGKLSWYQPLRCCHYIAFFALAIGVLNYPNLDWRFLSCERHTVPVGYDADGNPRVVMDILLFDRYPAEVSIARAQDSFPSGGNDPKVAANWESIFQHFIATFVPELKMRAQELQLEKKVGRIRKASIDKRLQHSRALATVH